MYSIFFPDQPVIITEDESIFRMFSSPADARMALKKNAQTPSEVVAVDNQNSVFVQGERNPILCRRCRNEVTTAEYMIAINGGHQHTFTNPAGVTYQIGCFSSAGGCYIHGIPTYEFTWFSGYAWAVAVCSKCLLHLGWYYQSEEGSFFGLIMDNLIKKIKLH